MIDKLVEKATTYAHKHTSGSSAARRRHCPNDIRAAVKRGYPTTVIRARSELDRTGLGRRSLALSAEDATVTLADIHRARRPI